MQSATSLTDDTEDAEDGMTQTGMSDADTSAADSAFGDTADTSVLDHLEHPVVVVVGPTASGKTDLAIEIALALTRQGQPAEVVNADAYQMYEGMAIGTAQPSREDLARVRHHLFGCVPPEQTMSVGRYQRMVRGCMAHLVSRGVRPVLVGGSGLYARAAVDVMELAATNAQVREQLWQRYEREGLGSLVEQLCQVDPECARTIDVHNPRRVIRALEVVLVTGRSYQASLPQYCYQVRSVQIGVDMPRSVLDERVNLRTRAMFEAGFVDEVRAVRDRLGLTAAKALGYETVGRYLDGLLSYEQMVDEVAQKTRRLARKQMSWFGRDPRVHWVRYRGGFEGNSAADCDAGCATHSAASSGAVSMLDEVMAMLDKVSKPHEQRYDHSQPQSYGQSQDQLHRQTYERPSIEHASPRLFRGDAL